MADKIGPCQKERSKICFGKDLWKNGRNTYHCLCLYGEKIETHKGDGHFFLIFCHRPLPHVGKFQGILNSLWVKMVHNPKKITWLCHWSIFGSAKRFRGVLRPFLQRSLAYGLPLFMSVNLARGSTLPFIFATIQARTCLMFNISIK